MSISIFFEDVAPEGDDVKQPPPSVPMQQDSTPPGPDPGHDTSDPPGPPPPPDEQDDIADDESLDPGDEFGDPDLLFLPPHPPPSPIETDHLKFDHLTGKRPPDEADKDIFRERQPSRRSRGREPPLEREKSPHRMDREFHWDPWLLPTKPEEQGPPATPAPAGIPQNIGTGNVAYASSFIIATIRG